MTPLHQVRKQYDLEKDHICYSATGETFFQPSLIPDYTDQDLNCEVRLGRHGLRNKLCLECILIIIEYHTVLLHLERTHSHRA